MNHHLTQGRQKSVSFAGFVSGLIVLMVVTCFGMYLFFRAAVIEYDQKYGLPGEMINGTYEVRILQD